MAAKTSGNIFKASTPAASGFLSLTLAFSLALSWCLPAWCNIADADSLLLDNKYKDAEDAYRELLDDDSTGDAYAGLAVALAKQSWPAKILEAEKILRQARGKFADNPNVMAAAGFVSYVHSKTVASPAKRDLYLEAGETLCNRAIKANSDIVIAQQTLGLIKMAQDDNEGAIEPLKKAVSLAENPVNLTLLAQALLKVDPKDKEAEEDVNKAIKMNGSYWPAHLQHALVLSTQGKNEDAFMELRNIPQNARTPDWSEIEGDIYRKEGDGPAALSSWREAIRQEPHNPEPYKNLAEYYAMRGDGEEAILQLHTALEILPNDMPLRTKLAELALRQDKLDVAETEYKTILASNPDDPSALLGLSRVYFRKARKDGQYPPDWQKLVDQLQNVVTETNVQGKVMKNGKDLQENIQLNEAEKALAQNRFKEARQFFSTVINTHRDDAYDLLTLGEQAFNDGDLRSAEQAYTFAKEIPEVASRADQGISKIVTQRNEAKRQTRLGDAMRQQNTEVAEDYYNQALIADPQCPQAYYGLFSLFSGKRGDPEKAVKYGISFLESTDETNPQRKEVESEVERLKDHKAEGGKSKSRKKK